MIDPDQIRTRASLFSTPQGERLLTAMDAPGFVRTMLKADIPALIDALAQSERDRDLAIAHDRQPYPTADAYEAVCAALKHRDAIIDRAWGCLAWPSEEPEADGFPHAVWVVTREAAKAEPLQEALARVTAERDELAATVAAERGDPAGALPGWEHDRHTGRWTAGNGCQILARAGAGTWNMLAMLPRKLGEEKNPTLFEEVPTARAGMRRVEELLTPGAPNAAR